MPKQNRYKNRFKSVGSSSLASGQSSQLQPQAQGSLAPGQSSQMKMAQIQQSSSQQHDQLQQQLPEAQASLASGQSSQLQPQAQGSSSSSYRASIPSSSSDEVSSQPGILSASKGSKRTKHKDDEDDRDWLVDVIVTTKMRLKLRNVHNLDRKLRIIVECDEYGAPIGQAGGLIAGILGQLAINPLYFPIGFVKWLDMPDSYLDRVFDEIIMPQFLFEVDREKAKEWVNSNLNKKWRDNRCTLWNKTQDPVLTKEEMIRKCPEDIPVDQWALFVNYRMKKETKNKLARQKQIPHTGGAKSLARRRADMKAKGKAVDRGQMWTETHKRKDGTYVTEEAREIREKIQEIRSQRPETIIEVSPNDALGMVLGPEHPGRVRGLGLGVVPTTAFRQTSRRIGRVNVGSSSTTTPQWQQEMASMRSQLNALLSLVQRNIGNIPEEFAHLFPPPPQASNIGNDAQSPIESNNGSNNDGQNVN